MLKKTLSAMLCVCLLLQHAVLGADISQAGSLTEQTVIEADMSGQAPLDSQALETVCSRYIVKLKDCVGQANVSAVSEELEDTAKEVFGNLRTEQAQDMLSNEENMEEYIQNAGLISIGAVRNKITHNGVIIEELKEGYQLLTLETAVDKNAFISGIAESGNNEIEYIQPDYQLEFAAAGENLQIVLSEMTAVAEEKKQESDSHAAVETILPEQKTGPHATDIPDMQGPDIEAETPVGTSQPQTADSQAEKDADMQPESVSAQNVTGQGAVVAVIDGGVDVTHPMFSSKITAAWDFINNDILTYDSVLSDQYYHGTHIAGIIAQTASGAQIMPLKVFENGKAYTSDIIAAIEYAAQNGADVVNCSFGGMDNNRALKEAMERSELLFICAAGNNRIHLDETSVYPACFALDNIITVASLNDDKGFSYFSNYGCEAVDLAAPGREIKSAFPGGETGIMSGTSMAAGVVSGAAALAVSMGENDIKARLINTADKQSNLDQKVGGNRALNLSNMIENMPGQDVDVYAADDFDVHGYQPVSEEAWNLFCAMDNIQVAAGGAFSLVLKADGTVWSWGNNDYGQLGDGTNAQRETPRQVIGLTGITKIAAGYAHAVALKNDGTLYAWGYNQNGRLGDGTGTPRNIPVPVSGLTNVKEIAAGENHTAAITKDGSVYAWGDNSCGQLGDGTARARSVPQYIIQWEDALQIAAGGHHTAAVKADGTVYTWGDNAYGQLGDGTTMRHNVPQKVNAMIDAVYITAGKNHTAVIREDGTAYAWGDNTYGQLGNGSVNGSSMPVAVSGLTEVTKISAGERHTAAITESGAVYTWGDNTYGQLGDGSAVMKTEPVRIDELTGAWIVSAGAAHMIVCLADNSVYVWGSNICNQLGYSTNKKSAVPLTVYGLKNVQKPAAGMYHSLALKTDGSVYAWGNNSYGQLGDGTKNKSNIPGEVSGLSGVTDISAGYYHSLALLENGELRAWGSNQYGQLGDGTRANFSVPTAVGRLNNVIQIASGAYHNLALTADGYVYAWGRNNAGQLGDGTNSDRGLPVMVLELSDVKAVAAGDYNSFAIKEDGSVWAWGSNQSYQLGDGTAVNRNQPVHITGLDGASDISAGTDHMMAITSSGRIATCGYNAFGQLGMGLTVEIHRICYPEYVNNISAIAAGGDFCLAVKTDGTVYSWGHNDKGQLGNKTFTTRYSAGTAEVSGDIIAVAAGYGHSLALKRDQTLVAWGNNGSGQLGDRGETFQSLTPRRITGEISDNAGASFDNAHEIKVDQLLNAAIESKTDKDMYYFTVPKSGWYKIQIDGDISLNKKIYVKPDSMYQWKSYDADTFACPFSEKVVYYLEISGVSPGNYNILISEQERSETVKHLSVSNRASYAFLIGGENKTAEYTIFFDPEYIHMSGVQGGNVPRLTNESGVYTFSFSQCDAGSFTGLLNSIRFYSSKAGNTPILISYTKENDAT